jgi:hypothetical protein
MSRPQVTTPRWQNIPVAMTDRGSQWRESPARSSLGNVPRLLATIPSPTGHHRQPAKRKISSFFILKYLSGIMVLPKAAQMLVSEIRMGGLRLSLLTVRAGLRSQESLALATLCSHSASKFSNPGSQQSISTRTFLLRTILHIRSCSIICPNSARSWQLYSNSPMPRKSKGRRGRTPGLTAGNAGGKVTN